MQCFLAFSGELSGAPQKATPAIIAHSEPFVQALTFLGSLQYLFSAAVRRPVGSIRSAGLLRTYVYSLGPSASPAGSSLMNLPILGL